jgi:hypothetical protein
VESTSHLLRCKNYVLDAGVRHCMYLLLLKNKFVSYSDVEVSETKLYAASEEVPSFSRYVLMSAK